MKRSSFLMSLLALIVAPFAAWAEKKKSPFVIRYSITIPDYNKDEGFIAYQRTHADQSAADFIAHSVINLMKVSESIDSKGRKVLDYKVIILPQ